MLRGAGGGLNDAAKMRAGAGGGELALCAVTFAAGVAAAPALCQQLLAFRGCMIMQTVHVRRDTGELGLPRTVCPGTGGELVGAPAGGPCRRAGLHAGSHTSLCQPPRLATSHAPQARA